MKKPQCLSLCTVKLFLLFSKFYGSYKITKLFLVMTSKMLWKLKRLSSLVVFAEILDGIFRVGNDCGTALFPSCRANFTVGICVLESLDKSEKLENQEMLFWNLCSESNLNVSSTLLPTGRSFIVIWRRIPFPSMMNNPRSVWPRSSK